jgi:hypothetical protein
MHAWTAVGENFRQRGYAVTVRLIHILTSSHPHILEFACSGCVPATTSDASPSLLTPIHRSGVIDHYTETEHVHLDVDGVGM